MGIKLGFLLRTLHDNSDGYNKVPSFVGEMFKAAGAPFLSKADESYSYKIYNDERPLNSHMVSGIVEPYRVLPLMRYLMKKIPQENTIAIMSLLGFPEIIDVEYQPLIYAVSQQFFRCVLSNKEADNIIFDNYNQAINDSSIMFDDTNPNILSVYLTEVGNYCPICGKSKQLIDIGNGLGKNYSIVKIFPDFLTPDKEEEYKKIREKPIKLDDFSNKIALCNECANKYNYIDKGNVDTYKKLLAIKDSLLLKREETRELNTAQLLPKIKDVVSLIKTGDILKDFSIDEDVDGTLTYDPANVRDKIKNDDLLYEEVNFLAVKYYSSLSEFFRLLDKNNEGSFDEVCYQIKKIYRTLKNKGHSQTEIYHLIADFINERTFDSKDYDGACRIVVAFFIQDCEVFEK